MATDVVDHLATGARTVPERPALVVDGAAVTYRSLDLAAGRLAASLAALGWAPGASIGLVMRTTALTVAGWYAARRAGLRPVLLGARWTPEAVAERLDVAGVEAVVADGAADVPSGTARYDLRRLLAADGRPVPPASSTETIVFTSGSTGRPKGVRLSDAVLDAAAEASTRHLGHAPGDRWLTPLPLHHVGGLMVVVRSLQVRGTAVLQARFDPAGTADALVRGDIRFASIVPTMLADLLAGRRVGRPRSLDGVLVGGGPIPAGLVADAEARGIPVLPTYGMSETAGQVATRRPGSAAGSPPRVLPGVRLRIVEDDGSDAPAGTPGRIEVAGPAVADGYVGGPAFGGRFLTPDVGRLTSDGGLEVLGRADATIVTGGENVDPLAVERVLRSLPGVRDAVVVGLPDDRWGAIVGTVVDLDEGAALERIMDLARKHLGSADRPRRWVAGTVPRTELGKPDRGRAAEMLRGPARDLGVVP